MQISPRDFSPRTSYTLEQAGQHPLLARLYAARGVNSPAELEQDLAHLLPPNQLTGTTAAARLLADAIAANKRIAVIATR